MKLQLSLIVIFLFTLTSSCLNLEKVSNKSTIPTECQPTWQLFLDYAPSNIKATPFTILLRSRVLDSNGKRVAGIADRKLNEIHFDTTSTRWSENNTHLILHELGHLILDRDHTNQFKEFVGIDDSIMPKSIMNNNVGIPEKYWDFPVVLDHYMTELFE